MKIWEPNDTGYDELFHAKSSDNFDDRSNGSGICWKQCSLEVNGKQINVSIPIHLGKSQRSKILFPTK